VTLRDIKGSKRARIGHQMLNTASAPHSKQPPLFRVLRFRTTAPQRIVKAIRFDDHGKGDRIIVCLGLTQVLEQLCPAVRTWGVLANTVQGCRDHLILHSIDT
jgi:hypothetical protein